MPQSLSRSWRLIAPYSIAIVVTIAMIIYHTAESFRSEAIREAGNISMTAPIESNSVNILVQSPLSQAPKDSTILSQPHQANVEACHDPRPHETGCEEPPLLQEHNGEYGGTGFSEGLQSSYLGSETGFAGLEGSDHDKLKSTATFIPKAASNEEDCGPRRDSELQIAPSTPPPEHTIPGSSSIDCKEQPGPRQNSKRNSSRVITPLAEAQKRAKIGPTRGADIQDTAEKDGYQNKDHPTIRPHEDQGEEDQKAFACPYFRFDPAAHQECSRLVLRRIRDVKQHLQRRHYLSPNGSCPICFKTFKSTQAFTTHLLLRNCEPKSHAPTGNIEGVSLEAQDLLKHRVNRADTPIQQWYSVWDILFDKVQRPPNPYLGSMVTETINIIQRFLQAEGSVIIPVVLGPQPWSCDNPETARKLVNRLLEEVGAQFEKGVHSSSTLANSTEPVVKSESLPETTGRYSSTSYWQGSEERDLTIRCSSPQPIDSINDFTLPVDDDHYFTFNDQFVDLDWSAVFPSSFDV